MNAIPQSIFQCAVVLTWIGSTALSVAAPGTHEAKPTMPHDHGDEAGSAPVAGHEATVPATVTMRPLAPLEPERGIYHGVVPNTDNRDRFLEEYRKYCEPAGRRPSMIGTFHAMWSEGVRVSDAVFAQRLRLLDEVPGVVPVVKFITGDWLNTSEAFLRADDILEKKHDAVFEGIARQAREFGKPFPPSINHENVNHLALDAMAESYPNKPPVIAEWGTEVHRGPWYRPQPYPGDASHMETTFRVFLTRYPKLQ